MPGHSRFWLAVHDAESARDAVRMAGLPVLLMGAATGLQAMLAAMKLPADAETAIGSAVVAALLIVVAFRLRGGHAAWLPLVAVVFVILIVMRTATSIAAWRMADQSAMTGGALLIDWIIPLICAALMLRGVRAWLWLRSQGRPRSL